MTSSLPKRLFTIATVLVLFLGGASFLLNRAKSSEVRPLRRDLNEIPVDMENWQGVDRKIDEEIEKTVGARHAISRTYTEAKSGRMIGVHIADWDSLKTPTLPHPPGICYPTSGAEIVHREPIVVEGPEPITAELLVVKKNGAQSLVLYWYAWDKVVCTTRGQACLARLKMIGSREWPPVVKVMLDTSTFPNESDARDALQGFASQIRESTKGL